MGIIKRMLASISDEPETKVNTEHTNHNEHSELNGLPRGEFVEKRVRGRITKVHDTGYGFITSKEIPYTRIFFHWSGLKPTTRNFKDLHKGLLVEFNPYIVEGRGYRAIKIEVVDGDEE